MRPKVLEEIHRAHKGLLSCIKLAKENVFWPNMNFEITKFVESCSTCQSLQKDKPAEQLRITTLPTRPWQIEATDLCSLDQKTYLIIADQFFDFIQVSNFNSISIIKELKKWFALFGIPDQIISDGGPQFSSGEFNKFAATWKFHHKISSPQFARSNVLAERYIQGKLLLRKCFKENSDVYLALLNNRNTPRGNIGSPVERLMGRKTKSLLPCAATSLRPKLIDPELVSAELAKWQAQQKISGDQGKKPKQVFNVGEHIMWRKAHRDWTPATIVEQYPNSNSYIVETADGARYRRNSWFLRPRKE